MRKFNNLLTPPDCLNLLEKQLQRNDIKLIEYSIVPISDKIEGYLAYHLRLKCLVLLQNENRTKIVTFFIKKQAKSTIGNEWIDNCLKSTPAERKELLFYQILNEASFLDENRTWVPKYYPFERDTTLLILDDMTQYGFKVHNTNAYDLQHSKVLLSALAQMHAFSIKYENEKSTKMGSTFNFYDAYGDEIFEEALLTRNIEFGTCYLKSSIGSVKKAIEYFIESPSEVHLLNTLLDKKLDEVLSNLVQPSKEFRNVLCHADLWPKNFMFKYDENNVPQEACLFDFQIIRYVPPISDVIMFLYVNTTREFRDLHLRELLEYYYNQLRTILQFYGIEIDEIYSKIQFDQMFQRYLPFGQIVGVMHRITSAVDENSLDKILDSKLGSLEFLLIDRAKHFLPLLENNVNGYRDKCREIIDELKEYLNLFK